MTGIDNRIRLTILGGFLGSGKSTWLRHQLHSGSIGKSWIIVNEAAEISVDDALLSRSSRMSVLAGGCACCEGRANLIATLRGLCDLRVGANEQIGHIVLEASGLADPAPIMEAIRSDPVLVHHIVVSDLVVIVDALHGLAQIAHEPLSRSQIGSANRLIVTKLDQAEEGAVKRLVATLASLNPGAAISGTVMGSATQIPDAAEAVPESFAGAVEEPAAPILAARVDLDPSIDWTAFAVWLSALLHARGDDIMRVKGVMRTPAGRLLLQSVRKVVQSPEILPESESSECGMDNSIVFIGRGFRQTDLRRSLRFFAGGWQPE